MMGWGVGWGGVGGLGTFKLLESISITFQILRSLNHFRSSI
jgi:hypothetical protein